MTEDIRRLSDLVIELKSDVSHLAGRLEEHKKETTDKLKEMREKHAIDMAVISVSQQETRELLSKGKGAVWVLTMLGGLAAMMLSIGRDMLKPLWGH
jgi:translation initiation factor IF-3